MGCAATATACERSSPAPRMTTARPVPVVSPPMRSTAHSVETQLPQTSHAGESGAVGVPGWRLTPLHLRRGGGIPD